MLLLVLDCGGWLRNIVLCCCRGQLIRDLVSTAALAYKNSRVVELDGPAGDRLFFWLFFHRFCLQWQPLHFSVLVILAATTGFYCLQGFPMRWCPVLHAFMQRLHISLKRSQGRPLSLAPVVASSP